MTEAERVRWHHQLNGHEFEQAMEVGDGQGGLVCCSPWDRGCGRRASGKKIIRWIQALIATARQTYSSI